MKRKKIYKHNIIVLVAFIGMIIGSCSDPNDLGMELLPTTDLIGVNSLINYDISVYTLREDSIRTDELSKSLIGSFADPVFGKTTIDLASQFRLPFFPNFEDDAVADSIFLYLYYKEFTGDTLTPLNFKIFELNNSLDVDQKYYQDEDLTFYATNNLLADFDYIPKRSTTLDTTYNTLDTIYQEIRIPLDMSLAEKLISADSIDMVEADVFLEYFKGLYIKSEELTDKGAILSLDLLANTEMNGSALLMFYHQTNAETGIQDTLSNAYLPSKFSARVNSFNHDYSGLAIENAIGNENQPGDKVYIQSTGGLRTKLFVPALDTWKDSINVGINKAELVFQIDSIASELDLYTPPAQLLLTIIDDEGAEYLPNDYYFSPTFYGGSLDTTSYTYSFNITQHMQEIVDGKFENNGFYLSVANKNTEFRRVILEGGEEKKGIQLKIAYSKVYQ